MKRIDTQIDDLFIVKLNQHIDNRGSFSKVFCSDLFKTFGVRKSIKQVNISNTSKSGIIRGMHFQYPPYAETKIIKCISGAVFDVAIDIRRDSETFLNWHGEYLNSGEEKVFVIPEGFAHGFQALEDKSQLLYFHTEKYNKEHEAGISYKDPLVQINWPIYPAFGVSERDSSFTSLDALFKGVEL